MIRVQVIKAQQSIEDKIKYLIDSGVLSTVAGSVEIHFDDLGNLRKIEQHRVILKS